MVSSSIALLQKNKKGREIMLVGTLSIYNDAKQADKAIKSVKHTNTLNYLRGQNQKKNWGAGQWGHSSAACKMYFCCQTKNSNKKEYIECSCKGKSVKELETYYHVLRYIEDLSSFST